MFLLLVGAEEILEACTINSEVRGTMQTTTPGKKRKHSCVYLHAFWFLDLVHELTFKVFKNTVQQNEDNFNQKFHNPKATCLVGTGSSMSIPSYLRESSNRNIPAGGRAPPPLLEQNMVRGS